MTPAMPDQATDLGLREQIARMIYEFDPFYESGEFVEGFCVSPGGHLTWREAQARDAEFGEDPVFKTVLGSAYALADALLALLALPQIAKAAQAERLEAAIARALQQPNETASNGKALREMVRILRAALTQESDRG